MKRLAFAALASIFWCGSAVADPAEGMWRTEPGDTGGYLHVSVYECGAAICGVIRAAFDETGERNTGYEHLNKRMLWDMQPRGGGSYGDGRIWAPDRDKTYNSRMSLEGDTLEVSGCVFGICRGQMWQRVN